MKKMMVVVAMVLAMLCIVPSLCLAAGKWYTVNVNEVGVSYYTYLSITDTNPTPAFPAGTYFRCTQTDAKTMLATALTAASLGKTMRVWLEGVAPYSTLSGMYMTN